MSYFRKYKYPEDERVGVRLTGQPVSLEELCPDRFFAEKRKSWESQSEMLLGEKCSEEAAKTKGKVFLKSSGNWTLLGFFAM